jgi:branched-chain amino acid transport system ATP-binding protein
VSFGGVHALQGVDLEVGPGEVVSLIGPNGAGKTTLFNTISGLVTPGSGSVALDGVRLDRESPAARARRGVAWTFQRMELFEELTVLENLVVAETTLLMGMSSTRRRSCLFSASVKRHRSQSQRSQPVCVA